VLAFGADAPLNGKRVVLEADDIPRSWCNILPDLPEPLPPPLDPGTGKPISPSALERIFAAELIRQEVSSQENIPIPDEILETYVRLGRPTPLQRAVGLERYLKTPAKIFYKCENVSPAGSHKPNTAIAQAYYNKKEGTARLVTETGAGQWGSALALACAFFDMECTVYMTRSSYLQKPYRRTMMQLYGAKVFPSPSNQTKFGQQLLASNHDHPGSLGIAISEAIEDTVTHEKTKYSLGSVLNHVLLHQTIVGLEAKKQFEAIDIYPDVFIGCIGGGSNFSGFAYPFVRDRLRKKSNSEFIAVEPRAVPTMTKGEYRYDFGDTAGMTPLLKMFTVGHRYACPPIHAGGLRYHGKAPSLCLLAKNGIVKTVSYRQSEIFEAGRIFTETEGIVPAPETAHAVKAAIDIALEAKEKGDRKVIAFNLSGHGLLDLSGYQDFLDKKLEDFEPTKVDLSYLPKVSGD
jgi:tryptophan synthase beta chain